MKISVVTPAYNMEKYIPETIQSVFNQRGNFDIEYIIVNDGSIDTTENIILDVKKRLDQGLIPIHCNSITLKYIHQTNRGMYTAINNGFSTATGDIYAWIGGDDLYGPDTAFNEIVKWFSDHPESQWVKGMCGLISKDGDLIREGKHRTFYRDWVAEGIYGRETYFIEQESVFWKSELWEKVAPIPSHYRSAGDYWLWIQFAKHTTLESIPKQVAYFRIRPGQISSNKKKYREEQHEIYPHRNLLAIKVRVFSILFNHLPFFSPILAKLHQMVFNGKERNF